MSNDLLEELAWDACKNASTESLDCNLRYEKPCQNCFATAYNMIMIAIEYKPSTIDLIAKPSQKMINLAVSHGYEYTRK